MSEEWLNFTPSLFVDGGVAFSGRIPSGEGVNIFPVVGVSWSGIISFSAGFFLSGFSVVDSSSFAISSSWVEETSLASSLLGQNLGLHP